MKTVEELEKMVEDADKEEDWLLAAALGSLAAARKYGTEREFAEILFAYNAACILAASSVIAEKQYTDWLSEA